jgi:ubiquitin-conjugating enzyme E2 J2
MLIGTDSQYCTTEPRNLPNMGEKERGKPDDLIAAATSSSHHLSQPPVPDTSSSSTSSRPHATPTVTASGSSSGSGKVEVGVGWAATWQRVIWDKWRWGVLIALAVLVSRFSSGS